MSDDLDLAVIDVELAWRRVGPVRRIGVVDRKVRHVRLLGGGILRFGLFDDLTLGVDRFLPRAGRFAVEIGIGELLRRRAGIVDDVEGELAVIGAQARAAPDDLLELRHGADDPRQHDVLAGRSVHPRGQELGRRQDRRGSGLHVLELGSVGASDVALVRGHPADVIGMIPHRVRIQRRESLAHLEGVLLVHAEDDGLRVSVRLLEEPRQMPRDRPGPGLQRDHALEFGGVVFGIRDFPAVPVQLALVRPPAGGVVIGDHAVDPIRGEKAVRDALGQAVLVDRVAEVIVGVDVVLPSRRRGHADLARRLEPLQDFPPVAVVAGAAAVALVHDDQIEEVPRILAVQAGAILIAGDGLVDGEIHLAALDRPAPGYLLPRVPERAEVPGHGIVHQDVPVGQEQHSRPAVAALAVPAGGPELPADLKGHGRLARAGAEREQNPIPPLEDGLRRAIDRDLLIVAKRPGPVGPDGREELLGDLVVRDALGGPQAPP